MLNHTETATAHIQTPNRAEATTLSFVYLLSNVIQFSIYSAFTATVRLLPGFQASVINHLEDYLVKIY